MNTFDQFLIVHLPLPGCDHKDLKFLFEILSSLRSWEKICRIFKCPFSHNLKKIEAH